MTIDSAVFFKAILAMDAYNRGYGAGIKLPVKDEAGNYIQIGSATISLDRNDSIAQSIGFYAIAYNYSGGTIISFRGTDNTVPTIENPIPDDIYHGWPLGGGNTNSEQGRMAIEFYQAVAGSGNWLSANISLTGHSLGGGLAGYVGAIYDQNAEVFDSMTFLQAAKNTSEYIVSISNGAITVPLRMSDSEIGNYTPPEGYNIISFEPVASADLVALAYGAGGPWDMDLNGISGHYVEGEILGLMLPLRSGVAELNPYTLGSGLIN